MSDFIGVMWNACPVHHVIYYWSRATKFIGKLNFTNIEDDVIFAKTTSSSPKMTSSSIENDVVFVEDDVIFGENDVIFAEDDIFVEDDVIFAKMTSSSRR